MHIQFRKSGIHKVSNRLVDVAAGQILDVEPDAIARYTEGVHFDRVGADLEPAAEPEPAPDPSPEPEPEALPRRRGGRGGGGSDAGE